ncbi:nitrilase-related carbon-nitrogen hydrolase [Sphingomonas sp. MMS24-JH45]
MRCASTATAAWPRRPNSVFALDADRRILHRYDKAHLVPYGEYLPMPWLLKPLGLSRLVPGDMDFLPGPGPRTLDVPGFGAIGVQICYEIVFSGEVIDPAHRPRLLFNPSNDAWFGTWRRPTPAAGADARDRGGAAGRARDAQRHLRRHRRRRHDPGAGAASPRRRRRRADPARAATYALLPPGKLGRRHRGAGAGRRCDCHPSARAIETI